MLKRRLKNQNGHGSGYVCVCGSHNLYLLNYMEDTLVRLGLNGNEQQRLYATKWKRNWTTYIGTIENENMSTIGLKADHFFVV